MDMMVEINMLCADVCLCCFDLIYLHWFSLVIWSISFGYEEILRPFAVGCVYLRNGIALNCILNIHDFLGAFLCLGLSSNCIHPNSRWIYKINWFILGFTVLFCVGSISIKVHENVLIKR